MRHPREQLFTLAVGVTRHLLGAVIAAVLGGIVLGVGLLVFALFAPSVADARGWGLLDAMGAFGRYWLWGVAILAMVGLLRPRWFVREMFMSIDL